jgi:hypothetical protein
MQWALILFFVTMIYKQSLGHSEICSGVAFFSELIAVNMWKLYIALYILGRSGFYVLISDIS